MTKHKEIDVSTWLRMNGSLRGTCGFVYWTYVGSPLVIELYDHSDNAHNWFDSDIATFYSIKLENCGLLFATLSDHRRKNIKTPKEMVDEFDTVDSLIGWLVSSNVPYNKSFDPWV